MKKLLLIGVAIASFTATAQAKDWQVDYGQSKLTFTATQGENKLDGGFKKFTARIALDPEHPETNSAIDVKVDIASIYTGDAERDAMLPQKEWFDTSKFPQAEFKATVIRKTAPGQFEADGILTIKDKTQNLLLPFSLVAEGNSMHAKGHVDVMRNMFDIGTGSYANENYVKNPVELTVDVIAN